MVPIRPKGIVKGNHSLGMGGQLPWHLSFENDKQEGIMVWHGSYNSYIRFSFLVGTRKFKKASFFYLKK